MCNSKIPLAANTQPLVNKIVNLFTLLVCIILSTGCGATYVGVQGGVDIPLQKATSSTFPINSEVRGNGVTGGVSIEHYLSERFSILFNPTISTPIIDKFVIAQPSNPDMLFATTTHRYSYIKLPLVFRIELPFDGTQFHPYIGWGIQYVLGIRRNTSTIGWIPDDTSLSYHDNGIFCGTGAPTPGDVSSIHGILNCGVDLQMTDSWMLRFDTRFQRSLGDAYLLSISANTPTSRDVNTKIYSPLTHLSLSLSMLLRL